MVKKSSKVLAEVKSPRFKDYGVIIAPVVTEKSALVGSSTTAQCVVFRVDPRSNKVEIREAVERVFKVRVASIRTVNVLGKPKRTTSVLGRRARSKKAYVTLKEGERIDLVEGL